MDKLVLLIKHEKGVAIALPKGGALYPVGDTKQVPSGVRGRYAEVYQYDLDKIHQIELLPEEPDDLPPSIKRSADAALVQQFKLDQAKRIAENVRTNEDHIRKFREYEDSGIIKILGRAKVNSKGQIIHDKQPEVEVVTEPAVETPVEEVIAVTRPKVGRPKKEETKTDE